MQEDKTIHTAESTVDTIEALTEKTLRMRKAQACFASYDQEAVDRIFYAAAMAANKARIPLAKLAVEETGMALSRTK